MLADSHDVYLVCHPFAGHVGSLRVLLHRLGDLDGHHLAGAEGFYRPDLDCALVVLRFTLRAHARLGDGLIEMLAARAGLPMVIPDRLAAAARRDFFLDHVSRYTTYVQLYPGGDAVPLAERVALRLSEHISASAVPSGARDVTSGAPPPPHGRSPQGPHPDRIASRSVVLERLPIVPRNVVRRYRRTIG